MNELKPCPFCGRIPTVDDCGDNRFFVRCKCGIVQDKLYGQRCDAVRRWNTRRKQPDDPDANVGDMVSRQAAINIVDSETVSTNPEHFKSSEKFIKFMDDADIASFGKWQWANGFNTALVATKVQFKKMPSAQPERTCVNCGRTANNGGWYADGGTRCPIEEHYALPKDGFCHLWEKRNVTDDDYPERRTDE